jgi:monofunctional biosynthetic peptidoglycan transglycosylase
MSLIVFKRLLLIVVALLVAWIAFQWFTFPDVEDLEDSDPKTTAFMDRRRAELRRAGKDDTLQYQWVSYGRISPHLRRAVLVAEDNEFYEHEGVDLEAMREAVRRDWKRKRVTHGGSTITQQLAKNLYLSPSRNPIRKIKEYFIARELERHLTKKRILELYLNVVEMGQRIYGAEAAARAYFGKSAAALTPNEAALLAGSLPNPRAMNPGSPNRRLRARQAMILSRMRRWGHLVEKEVLTAPKPEAQSLPIPPTDTVPAPSETTDTDLPPETETTDTTDTTQTAGTTDTTGTTAREAPPNP